ncbi:uncharacterized protein TNCV_2677461 [Trichonephila clavipes]|nr:uncharacterized protein TNCV_2677461 [Trichonephila clavipes]
MLLSFIRITCLVQLRYLNIQIVLRFFLIFLAFCFPDRSLSSVDQQASSRQTLSLYPANKSIDGDPQSCTYTDKLRPRWIRVDMRKNQKVRAVAITVPPGIYSQDPAQLTIYAISVRDSTTASYHKCASFNGRFGKYFINCL